jgi:regulator of replication initiation timing
METKILDNYKNFIDSVGNLSLSLRQVTGSLGDIKDTLPALMQMIDEMLKERIEDQKKLSELVNRNKELSLVCDEMYKLICEHGSPVMKGHAKQLLKIQDTIYYRDGRFL